MSYWSIKVAPGIGAPTHLTERIIMSNLLTLDDTTTKLLFLLEARLFHGLTRSEALMLWNDGIDKIYDSVSTQTIH